MIEPTETESLQTLEAFASACETIVTRAQGPVDTDRGEGAPRSTPVRRVDEALAARKLVPTYDARR
jgi:glycine dehydrogenase subunit 2